MGMDSVYFYETKVVQNKFKNPGSEPRVGTLYLPDTDADEITVQSPQEFKGPHSANGKSIYITPEHLYVSSAAVCVFTTCVSVAENSKLEYKDIVVTGKGKLESLPDGNGQWISEIVLNLSFKIFKDSDMKKAEAVAEKTKKNCLVANSMKTAINFTFTIDVVPA